MIEYALHELDDINFNVLSFRDKNAISFCDGILFGPHSLLYLRAQNSRDIWGAKCDFRKHFSFLAD